MSRETMITLDHWSSAHVVQELGWRPRLGNLLPSRRSKGERAEVEPRDPREARLLLAFDVVHCVFLAGVSALIGLSRMSGGSLPLESVLPMVLALTAGLLAWLKALRWPPIPEWERFPRRAVDADEVEEVEEEARAPEPLVNTASHLTAVHKGSARKALDVVLALLLIPVLGVAVVVVVAGVAMGVLAWVVVRRGWPALAVVALLATVAPYASADGVGFTLFATGVMATLFYVFLLWPLQRWIGLPTPHLDRMGPGRKEVWKR